MHILRYAIRRFLYPYYSPSCFTGEELLMNLTKCLCGRCEDVNVVIEDGNSYEKHGLLKKILRKARNTNLT